MKKNKMYLKQFNIFGIFFYFVLAQIIGIFVGIVLINDFYSSFIAPEFVSSGESAPFEMIFYVLLGAVFLYFIIKYFPQFFTYLEFLVLFASSSVVFYALSRFIFPYQESIMLSLLFSLSLFLLKNHLKNFAAMIAAAGAGAVFGITFSPFYAALFLILLAIYDFIAVFITKHMVDFAKFTISRDSSFTVSSGSGNWRVDLGTGDLAAPILLEVAALSISPFASLFVFMGATFSMSLFMLLLFRRGVILPALPPQVAGMIIMLVVGSYVFGYSLV